MQVSHANDHITHAVIGGKPTIDVGISSSAEFFHVLSSTLYSDQILAVVREVLCNAWDAHIEAGRTDIPVEVTLANGKFIVKDSGLGIHHDDIGPIYGVYGASTKKNDGNQTGGFGLGCKAPWAYVEHFEVTSSNAGTKTIYAMAKSSAHTMGKPGITPIASFPTQETGLTVSIEVKPQDTRRFAELIRRIAYNGDMNITFNGARQHTIEFNTAKSNWIVVKDRLLDQNSPVLVRYGNVVYPVEQNARLIHWNKISEFLRNLFVGHRELSIVFQAPAHSITVTPSRESLSMQDKTVEMLNKLMGDFLNQVNTEYQEELERKAIRRLNDAAALGKFDELMEPKHELPDVKPVGFEGPMPRVKESHLQSMSELASLYLLKQYPKDLGFRIKDISHRVTLLKNNKLIPRGHADSFLAEAKKATTLEERYKWNRSKEESSDWFSKNLAAPLVKKVIKAGLNTGKLFVLNEDDSNWKGSTGAKTPPLTPISLAKPGHLFKTVPYFRNIIVLTTSRYKLTDRVQEHDFFGLNNEYYEGYFVYIVSPRKKEIEEAQKALDTFGMVVIDLTLKTEEAVPVVAPIPRAAPKKGLVCASSLLVGSTVNIERQHLKDAPRIMAPEFVMTLLTGRSHYTDQLGELTPKISTQILQLFGDKGGVATNSKQLSTYYKKGANSLMGYVSNKLHAYLHANQNVLDTLPFLEKIVLDEANRHGYFIRDTVQIIYRSSALRAHFGLINKLTKEDTEYLNLYMWLKGYRYAADCGKINELYDQFGQIKLDQKVLDMLKQVKGNKLLSLLDMDEIDKALMHPDQTTTRAKLAHEMLFKLLNS